MALFSFGGSKQDARSESFASSFDNVDSFGFNFGRDVSQSGSRSSDRIAFADVFRSLFGGATGAAAGIDTGDISGAANLLFGSGLSFIDDLAGGGAGASFLEKRIAAGDQLGDEQVGILGEDIEKFLTESVLPNITSKGVQAGTLGGGRGEVARGTAAEGALDAFRRGAVDIRGREQAQIDQLASTLLADETNRATAGAGALPGLFGLAESGALSGLSPFLLLSQILGGPTVLTDAESEALASGVQFGADSTVGRAGSTSRSSSSSTGRSVSFGFS